MEVGGSGVSLTEKQAKWALLPQVSYLSYFTRKKNKRLPSQIKRELLQAYWEE